jgi:argininosuccinate lyase
VKLAEERGIDLPDVPLSEMQRVEKRITKDVFSVLSVEKLSQKPQKPWGNRATERR